jgi:hypothetical protein
MINYCADEVSIKYQSYERLLLTYFRFTGIDTAYTITEHRYNYLTSYSGKFIDNQAKVETYKVLLTGLLL